MVAAAWKEGVREQRARGCRCCFMRDVAAALLGLACYTRTHTHTPLLSQSNSNESYACKRAESSNVIGVPMGPKEEEGRVSREWGLGQSCCGYGCAAVVSGCAGAELCCADGAVWLCSCCC